MNVRALLPLGLMLLFPLTNIFYVLVNSADRGYGSLLTDLDRKIPFVEAFVIPYFGWYFFIVGTLVYFFVKERKLYYTTLWSMLSGMLVCFIIYYFFQTVAPRPEITGDSWLSRMVQFVYSQDGAFNCFPSIHCLTTFLTMRAISGSPIKNKWNMSVIYLSGSLIILSTLFIKQHVVMDVLSSIVLGNVAFSIFSSFRAKQTTFNKKPTLVWDMSKLKTNEMRGGKSVGER